MLIIRMEKSLMRKQRKEEEEEEEREDLRRETGKQLQSSFDIDRLSNLGPQFFPV